MNLDDLRARAWEKATDAERTVIALGAIRQELRTIKLWLVGLAMFVIVMWLQPYLANLPWRM